MVQAREKVEVALLATVSPSNHIFDRPTFSYTIITTLAMCQAKIVVAIVDNWLDLDQRLVQVHGSLYLKLGKIPILTDSEIVSPSELKYRHCFHFL